VFDLVFLGTAAAVPSAECGLPALLVAKGPSRFLIDCGEGAQRQLMRAGLGFRGLAHVLLTHAHLDHVLGLAGLLATFALYRVEGTIEIVGSDETLAFAGRYLADTIGPEREGGYRDESKPHSTCRNGAQPGRPCGCEKEDCCRQVDNPRQLSRE
jgi:ribonuclease Z